MARPPKKPTEQADLRIPFHEGENDLRRVWADSIVSELSADPFGDFPLAFLFSQVIEGKASERERETVGKVLVSLLEQASPERASEVLGRLAKMKEDAGLPSHRNARAFRAYSDFVEIAGRDPSKAELKDFILARPESYGADWPGKAEPWSRIWAASGLKELKGR